MNKPSDLPKKDADKQPSFEQAVHRLQEISERMQQEGISLDESLQLFEEGHKLLQYCQNYLDQAEMRVEKVRSREDPQETETWDWETPTE